MEHTVSLRPLCEADAEAVAALVRRAFAAQSVPTDPPASALRLAGEDVRAHLAAGGGGVVATPGAVGAGSNAPGQSPPLGSGLAPVASVMWVEQDGCLYIARLAVDPAWRRRGVARVLLAAAETAAEERRLPRLHLGTRIVLADNLALFRACGFAEIARHAHPGYASPTWVELEKRLGAG